MADRAHRRQGDAEDGHGLGHLGDQRPTLTGSEVGSGPTGAGLTGSGLIASGPTGDRTRRVTGPILLAGAALAASVLLHVRDPHVSGSWGFCPWLLLTGTYCPGCGGLRAVHDLTHLDLRAAASSNLLVVAGLPLAAVWWGRTVADRWRGVVRAGDGRRRLLLATLVLSLAGCFAVLRNTGAGTWLAP